MLPLFLVLYCTLTYFHLMKGRFMFFSFKNNYDFFFHLMMFIRKFFIDLYSDMSHDTLCQLRFLCCNSRNIPLSPYPLLSIKSLKFSQPDCLLIKLIDHTFRNFQNSDIFQRQKWKNLTFAESYIFFNSHRRAKLTN